MSSPGLRLAPPLGVHRWHPANVEVWAGILIGALAGAGVALGFGLYVFALISIAAMTALGISDWKRSIFWLVAFLPYSGLFIIATYPNQGPATLLKDVWFIVPAYLGFIGVYVLRRRPMRVPGFPVALAAVFALLVAIQMLNPSIPNVLVGLIGAKVWLLYIPLAFLGYHLIGDKGDLERLLRIMCFAAVIPCAIGIIEAILVNTGSANLVYGWYGSAASAVTQGFADVGEGTTTVLRVSSTFSFVSQYYLFTLSMVAVAYAYWRGFLARRAGGEFLGLTLFVLVIFAALLTGARGAILTVPAMILVILALDGIRLKAWTWLLAATALTLIGAAAVFGTTVSDLVDQVVNHGIGQFTIATVDGFRHALSETFVGLGAGVDTVSARYALPEFDPYALIGGGVEESWWVKAVLELGVVGLIVAACLLLTVLVRVIRASRRLLDPQLRAVAAALVALLVLIVVNNLKGSYLDLDPTNVFFWLFVGVLLKLPALDERQAGTADG
jgi:hypothetical protein